MMEVKEVLCRSILTRTSGYLKAVSSHSLNPYIGCGFGRSACGVGCYVRANHWLTRGRPWGGFVEAKTNAADVYTATCGAEQRWAAKRGLPFSIFFSSATEPWQPLEKKFRITRSILQAMKQKPPQELILQTHSTGIRDDMKLIARLARVCDLRVQVSIEGDRDRLPGLPPPPATVADRIQLLRDLTDADILTVACLSPLYPLRDADAFFQRLAATGIRALVIDHFILGDGTHDGSRTLKTGLPSAMAEALAASTTLSYRDHVAEIARKYLPVGLSAEGFAGHYSAQHP